MTSATMAAAKGNRCDCCHKQLGPHPVTWWPGRGPGHPVAICHPCADEGWGKAYIEWRDSLAEAQNNQCDCCHKQLGPHPVTKWLDPDENQEQAVLICYPCAERTWGRPTEAHRQWVAEVVRAQNNQCDCCRKPLRSDLVPWPGPDPEHPIAICHDCVVEAIWTIEDRRMREDRPDPPKRARKLRKQRTAHKKSAAGTDNPNGAREADRDTDRSRI